MGSRVWVDEVLVLEMDEADPLYTRTSPLRKVNEAKILEVGSAAYCSSALGSDKIDDGLDIEGLRGILSVSRVTRSWP